MQVMKAGRVLWRCAYIVVIVQALLDHVELPVLSRVISYSRTVQPVAIVTAHIMVHLWKQSKMKLK